MAAVNGHHVAGTAYHWYHTWKPRDIATAMVYGKASPHGPHSEALRKVSHQTLGHRLDQSAAKGKFDVFDRLAAESDRREAYKSNARASRQAKADAASAAKTAHYDQLTAGGHDDESAIEKAFGIPVTKQRDQAALGQLRASGHSGAGLQEAARKGFTAETKARYKAAEDATNGHMLNNTGRSMGVDPASLMTGSEARARKYASPELKEWFDQNGRPTYAEYLDEIRGHVQGAANARAGRGAFHAAAARVLGVVALAADSMAKASSHEQVGKGGPLWKTPGLQLPAYIQHIANDLQSERGMDESRAIATAVAACKRWAAGGGKVDANTRAAATKAIAEWEAAKAKARSTVAASVTDAARGIELAYGAAPTVKPSPANRGQVHATTPATKTPVQHKVGAKVRTPAGKTGTVVKTTKSGAHVMCPGDKRPTFHPHGKLTPAGRAVSATAARVSLELAGAFNSAAHPRVSAGNTGGGQFTASGNAQAGASANGAGSKAGTNAAADNEAVNLMAKLQGMTPAQQSAFMAGLSGAQLQALGGWLSRNPQGTPAGKAAAAAILPVLSAHGLKPDGTMAGTAKGASKAKASSKAASKKSSGSSSKKSSGGGSSKSSGGSSGGSSGSSGSSAAKSSASKADAAKAAADKKAAAAKTAAEKKAAAAVAAAAKAKAAADAKAAKAATAAQKKAAADAQKAAAAQVKAAAAAAKAAAAAAAAAKKKPPGPVPPPPPSRKTTVAASYQAAGRRLLDLANASSAEAEPTVGKQIPTVSHLRRAMQAFEQFPPSQRPGLLADIRGATTTLGAGHLEWVSSFLRAHGTAST
jgi:hypothetical protein